MEEVSKTISEMQQRIVSKLEHSLSAKFEDFLHPADKAIFAERRAGGFERESALSPVEFRVLRKDGAIKWLELFENRIELNGKLANLKCHNCNNNVIYPEGLDGEKVCSNCGLVIDETPTFKGYTQWAPEWYSNWNEEDSETLKEWLTILRVVSCQLNIPNYPYREEAARTIRTQNHSLFKSQKLSKNKRATIAALMHLILKEYNKMRSIKEISKELSLDNRTVMKQAWLLNKTIKTKKELMKIQRRTSVDYLHEYAGKITEDKELIVNAENTLLKIKRSGGNPIGLAAGAFYNACKKKKSKISKEKIGKTFCISERTVYTNEVRIRKLMVTKAAAKLDVRLRYTFETYSKTREDNITEQKRDISLLRKNSLLSHSIKEKENFSELLLEAIDETLSSLGETPKKAIYYQLETVFNIEIKEIPNKIDDFSRALEKLFGVRAKYLEIVFMKNLYAKVRGVCERKPCEGVLQVGTFKAYVNFMKQNYEEASRNEEEIGILINENEKLPRCS